MERLSALMDGELSKHAVDGELDRIKGNAERESAWATFHLIGDALRGQVDPVQGIGERVHTMLANEPTVLAPRLWKTHPVMRRLALPLAASVCGIAVVAWLTLSDNSVISPGKNYGTPDMLATAPQVVQQAEGSEAGAIHEYLMAHQQFSPSTVMQGVVPYVRTVSSGDDAR
jgi:sigma-E factor negative regulatory protein RseA